VSTLAYQGTVPDAMVSAGGDGVVVVLGSGVAARNLRLLSRLRRTTAERVAESGHAPLVVVSLAGLQSAGPSRGRVVVGVGDDESRAGGGSSLAYAFDAALRRGTGVSVVRASTSAGTGELWVERALCERTQQEILHRAVAPYRDAFPGVDVRERVLLDGASAALVDESDGATLLVVGSGQRRGLRRLRPGQVRRAVLRRAHAPVVVVPVAAPAPLSWWRRLVLPPALGAWTSRSPRSCRPFLVIPNRPAGGPGRRSSLLPGVGGRSAAPAWR
jgi:nucleotide-binding universal stress UspA family protein